MHERIRYDCSECSYKGISHNILNMTSLFRMRMWHLSVMNVTVWLAKSKFKVWKHKQSINLEAIYGCNEFDSMAKHKYKLKEHKQARHEGVTYGCKEYDYKATWRDRLTLHVNTKHEGLMCICDSCAYKAIAQRSLTDHKKSKHQDVGYKFDRMTIKPWQSP